MYNSRPFYLAFKFLIGSTNNRNILGAIMGIGLALIPLIVVLEISSGMIEGITKRYMEVGSYHLQIKSYSGIDIDTENELIKKVHSMEGVKSAFPVSTGLGLAYSQDGRTGINFKALPADYWDIDTSIKEYIKLESGEFNLETKDSAMISTEVARILNVIPGDRIKILTARQVPGRDTVLKPSYLTVRGIFSTGYYELDALSIYINIDKGKTLFTEKESFFIAVKLNEPLENINNVTDKVRKLLDHTFLVYNWYDLEKSMIESFNTTKTILLFIMIIIVIVASMNISSTVVMMVLEKESEIAILRSTGVPSYVITRAFVYIGFIIGIIGSLIGLILGLLTAVNINWIINFTENIVNFFYSSLRFIISPLLILDNRTLTILDSSYYLEEIPIRLDMSSILIISTLTIMLSVIAGYFPAIRAGKLKPMDIIRKH
jgi:lipoprotein-releasing system permease protein